VDTEAEASWPGKRHMNAKDIWLVVVIPLILAELGPWCGWLAGKLVPRAARLRYGRGDRAAVRAEEWSNDLGNIPGQLSKFVYALAQLIVGSIVGARREIVRISFGDRNSRGPVIRAIYRVPYALLWLAEKQLRREQRYRYGMECRAELDWVLTSDEPHLLIPCIRGTRYSASIAFSAHHLRTRRGERPPRLGPSTDGPSDPSPL
jgi:hypothetical protein